MCSLLIRIPKLSEVKKQIKQDMASWEIVTTQEINKQIMGQI